MKHRVLLCAALAGCALGLSACTSHSCGDNLKWRLNWFGTLTISGTGEMKDWEIKPFDDDRNPPWLSKSSKIKKVVIKDGVTSIGDWAFFDCNMTEISIPDSVTSIGEYSLGS